jgi:hypothetical protein
MCGARRTHCSNGRFVRNCYSTSSMWGCRLDSSGSCWAGVNTATNLLQHVFIALFQLALSFSKWQTERYEQVDVVYGALLPLTEATFVLLRFCPQEVLCWCHWRFIGTEVLLTFRLLVTVTTLLHTWCVFLLWSFLMAEIKPKLCSLLLGILCHIEPRAPWLLFTPASLGFDWGPLRSLVVFVNRAMHVLNDDESSTKVI